MLYLVLMVTTNEENKHYKKVYNDDNRGKRQRQNAHH